MPNCDQNSDFYAFVLTYFRNDPYMMLDRFESDIARVAADVSIDWYQSKHNVDLDGVKISGKRAKGLTGNDNGRIWIIAHECEYESNYQGNTNIVKYPLIRFQNFRIHFPEPVFFKGIEFLWKEFDRYRQGARINRSVENKQKKHEHTQRVKKLNEEELQAKAHAVDKDNNWRKYLSIMNAPCPYFSGKGVPEIYKVCQMYFGNTTLGRFQGDFTAICMEDAATSSFRGLQRIYPGTGEKVFRRGLDPMGAVFRVGSASDGMDIYILEAPADAGMCQKLTGCCSLAAMFADNIPVIAAIIRNRFPNSRLIFVADNDQYGSSNKGLEMCETAILAIDGDVHLILPLFKEKEKRNKMKDLTDYAAAYGEDEARKLLFSYR